MTLSDHAALCWLPVWQRNFRVWVKLVAPAIFGNFGEPLLYLLALSYGLGSFVGNQQTAQFFPLTHAVDLIRPLMIGSLPNQILLHLVVLSGYAVGASLLAISLIKRRLMA